MPMQSQTKNAARQRTNVTQIENFRLLEISLCCQSTAKLHVGHLLFRLESTNKSCS